VHRRRCSPLLGVLKNDTPPIVIDNSPFFDLLQRSITAKAGQVVVQATISDARRLSRGVDVSHDVRNPTIQIALETAPKSLALSGVKESLTVDQIVHLLCIGAQRTLSAVRSVQGTE
jgi:hypothetical protein